jgi:hypothetical protein
VNCYLIRTPKKKRLFYSEGERVDSGDLTPVLVEKTNYLDRFLARLGEKETRSAKLLQQLIVGVRDGYFKLENAIDPLERIVKRFRHAQQLELCYPPELKGEEASAELKIFLMAQRNKHTIWMAINAVVTLLAIPLTPILMPLPGPNVLFYYPLLRTFSHYLSRQAAQHGMRLEISAQPLQALANIEELLRTIAGDNDDEQLEIVARNLKLEGLPAFLKRYI